jgi:hypothetical protein
MSPEDPTQGPQIPRAGSLIGRLDAMRMREKWRADAYRYRLADLELRHFRLLAWAWYREVVE